MTSTRAAGAIAVTTTAMTVNGGDGQCSLIEAITAANTDVASGPAAGECAAGAGLDVITLPPGIYTLTLPLSTAEGPNGLPLITGNTEIAGAGAAATIIERSAAAGTPDFRLMYVRATGSLVLRGVTLRNGRTPSFSGGALRIENNGPLNSAIIDSALVANSSGSGGAVWANVSVFTVRGSLVEGNVGTQGPGGVYVPGRMNVENSSFIGNRTTLGYGGAISTGYNGVMDISGSVFRDNYARARSGAIEGGGATVLIRNSQVIGNRSDNDTGGILALYLDMTGTTVANNTAGGNGGGVTVVRTAAAWGIVRDSTITGNRAGATAGGIDGANLTMSNTSVSGNFAVNGGSGIYACGPGARFNGNNLTVLNNSSSFAYAAGGGICFAEFSTLANSIIANNYTGTAGRTPDCYTSHPVTSLGHNTIGNACNCVLNPGPGDQLGTYASPIDPLFASLADNGGPTATHLPGVKSPALDSASALAPGSDPSACSVADQRGVFRPIDGDGDLFARSDRGSVETNGNPLPARPVLTASTYSVDEPAGAITISVEREDASGNVDVDFRTIAVGATDGADFLSAAGTLSFLDGEAAKTFTVTVLDDVAFEPAEAVVLELRAAGDPVIVLPYSSATLFIKDDDNFPYVRSGDRVVVEGNVGTVSVPIAVELYKPYQYAVGISYTTVDGTATAGADYVAVSGSFTIAASNAVGTIHVPIIGDAIDEPDEQFTLRFITTVGCISEVRFVTVTITDDDIANRAPIVLPISDRSDVEGDAVSLAVMASDPDGDELSFAAAGLPPGVAIDAGTGAIAGTVAAGAAGSYSVTIEVSDGALAAETSFLWTIALPNRPPVVSAPPPQSNLEGDVVTLAITAGDPDGDALIFTATGLPPGIGIDPSTGLMTGTLSAGSAGLYTVTITVDAGALQASASFTWQVIAPPPPPPVNEAPRCSAARPTLPIIWPPNHKKTYTVGILDVTDPDGDAVTIVVTAIRQDEPTNTLGDGTTWIDGGGVGTAAPWVRAERMGGADGRVYHISFTATDPDGASCAGSVRVGVPHDMGKPGPIDGGPLYDSTYRKQ